MAYGYNLEAEYADGYTHTEDEADASPYVPGKNIFNDIVEKRPEADHGPMVRFSLVGSQMRYDIDWAQMPADARPIYYRHMQADMPQDGGAATNIQCLRHVFGYQYNDDSGRNVQEVKEL